MPRGILRREAVEQAVADGLTRRTGLQPTCVASSRIPPRVVTDRSGRVTTMLSRRFRTSSSGRVMSVCEGTPYHRAGSR